MSDTHLSTTYPKAQKPYYCDWCGGTIHAGERHTKWSGVWDGALTSTRLHSECSEAADREMEEMRYGDTFDFSERRKRGHTMDESENHDEETCSVCPFVGV